MVMAIPTGNPLAKSARRSKLQLRAFADETFIVYGRRLGPGLYDATISACHEAGFSPRFGQEAPRIASTLNLVAAGLGVAMVPASLQHMRVDGVGYCPLKGSVQPTALLAIASRRGDPWAAVRKFLQLIARMAARLVSVSGNAPANPTMQSRSKLSPRKVSSKWEYSAEGLETFGRFSPKLSIFGVWRLSQNARNPRKMQGFRA
jgi:hypothetical protein